MSYMYPKELNLIQKLTASSSATISFTSGINTNFPTYVVKIRNMIAATGASTLQMLYSTDGGSTYLSSNYYSTFISNNTASVVHSGTGASAQFSIMLLCSSTNVLNGQIVLYDLGVAKQMTYRCNFITVNSDGNIAMTNNGGTQKSTTAINAVRFQMSSGNIASGDFYLYGVNES